MPRRAPVGSTRYYETGLNPWDLAAGGLVAREAGALVGGPVDDVATRGPHLGGRPGLAAELGRCPELSARHAGRIG